MIFTLILLFCETAFADFDVFYLEPVIQEFSAVYPEVEIIVQRDNLSVVASASRGRKKNQVVLAEGLVRSPRLSEDTLRFVICHELGHLYGGAPFIEPPPDWNKDGDQSVLKYTSEGQSDYYAAAVCFRQMAKRESHNQQESKSDSAVAQTLCEPLWGEKTDGSMICQRTLLAGLGMLNLVKDFEISLERRAKEFPLQTVSNHYPSRQCRLDTIVNGALCATKFSRELSFINPLADRCENSSGRRPRCWFNPQDFDISY